MKKICSIAILIFIMICCVSPFYIMKTKTKNDVPPPTAEQKAEIYKTMMADGVIKKKQIIDNDVIEVFNHEKREKEIAHKNYMKYLERKAKEAEEARIKAIQQNDIAYIAKTVWGEARGLSYAEKAQVAWCILNRVDDGRFPNTVVGVVTQSGQFYGYSASFPTSEWAVAEDVYTRWLAEKNGESVNRELPSNYCYFSGDGVRNYFRANA
ncbi:MAG: cell wall hydrolase [Prevotellaceae bacterium]|nr:cell wall hydrolase [Candidatus Faecinaster equi]